MKDVYTYIDVAAHDQNHVQTCGAGIMPLVVAIPCELEHAQLQGVKLLLLT